MTTGLVIGKFLPPHAGHAHLIGVAAAGVDRLSIVLFSKSHEAIPGLLRERWLRELFPAVDLHHVAEEHPVDIADPACWSFWIAAIRSALPRGPDLVFSSAVYGEELARRLGARHVPVDPGRLAVPVSGTAIRERPLANWDFIPRCVRPRFVRRVALVGAESTGKSTLAAALALRFGTSWVSEYAREHLGRRGGACLPGDLPIIAHAQAAAEDEMTLAADRYLFCDTDLVTTVLWSRRYFGVCDPEVARLAGARRYDLTLLLANDIPWVDDGLRDSPGRRKWFFEEFRRELTSRGRVFQVISGSGKGRFERSEDQVRTLA